MAHRRPERCVPRLIAYDNYFFYWYRNNVLVTQRYYPNAGPLYLYGDFFEPGQAFVNMSFAPYSQATPHQLIARGGATVADTNVIKSGGAANSWDSDAYSINGYPQCHVVWKASQITGNFMVGLCTAPPASPVNAYASINYALYMVPSGGLDIYESGALVGSFGTYATTDYLSPFCILRWRWPLTGKQWQNNTGFCARSRWRILCCSPTLVSTRLTYLAIPSSSGPASRSH